MNTNTRARIPSPREREACIRTDFAIVIENKKEV
jgi:hypothetical protein